MNQRFGLNNKVAIVTGAAQGIGESIARVLAEFGASVVLADVNITKARLISDGLNRKGESFAFRTDVVKSQEVKDLFRETMRRFGTVSILVNNAGILYPTAFDQIEEDEWKQVIDVNLNGVFLCCREAFRIMKAEKYGKIVNISSTAGKTASTFGGAHYTASKSAVLGLTRHLAREGAPYQINVNAVCPGSIDTPMIHTKATPERIEGAVKNIPFGRLGKPEEVALLVLFLCSDASSYITGASFDINGGELII
jgi:NAD(P)-dependent dehydrogenase (short-subunit alcohol dehydrogenase family)